MIFSHFFYLLRPVLTNDIALVIYSNYFQFSPIIIELPFTIPFAVSGYSLFLNAAVVVVGRKILDLLRCSGGNHFSLLIGNSLYQFAPFAVDLPHPFFPTGDIFTFFLDPTIIMIGDYRSFLKSHFFTSLFLRCQVFQIRTNRFLIHIYIHIFAGTELTDHIFTIHLSK